MKKLPLLVVSSLLLVTSCSGSDDKLFAKLQQQILPVRTMTSGYHILNLDSLTDFEWDSVYWFHNNEGFNTDKLISNKIGFSWEGEAIPDHCSRILFVHKNEVVDYVDCRYYDDDGGVRNALPIQLYGCSKTAYGIARKQAKFAVFRLCNHRATHYPFLPLTCLENFKDFLAVGCKDLPAE
jgi:hypothetical protein